VPELLAEEMATELETDLAEAQADGVSSSEIFGESDPRHLAAVWAQIEQPGLPLKAATVPTLVGLTACHARKIALAAGLRIRNFPHDRCDAEVVAQRPAPGTLVAPRTRQATVTLRLRRARR
jgi:hypothetical protein